MAAVTPADPAAQYRLTCVQLYNWGTFCGHHTLRVPRQGLLLTGQSGSGKSSLLDAISTVLVASRDLKYNVAAQDSTAADRSRTMLSYVRGAYRRTTDEITGELRSDYLRQGNTKSAIALTFERLRPADTVTLIALFHARAAATTSSAMTTSYVIAEGKVGLDAFLPYANQGVDSRAIRKDWGDSATVYDTYNRFAARFRRRLGLSNEVAQRLLHKTQSAKNLTSLDTLLRDFMLDEPSTFKDAAAAVEQFAELSDAHNSVVDARRQEQVLLPLREVAGQIEQHGQQAERAGALKDAIDPYVLRFKQEAYQDQRAQLERQIASLRDEHEAARQACAHAEATFWQAQRTVDGMASAGVGEMTARLESAEEAVTRVSAARARLAPSLEILGSPMPTSGSELAELQAASASESRELTGRRTANIERDALIRAERHQLEAQMASLREQAERARSSRSGMSDDLVRARHLIAQALGTAPQALPFVGEVMELAPGAERWRVAAEAVAGGFARTMIVPDHLYRNVAAAVDAHNLRTLLTYERMLPETVNARRIAAQSLAARLRATGEGEIAQWLNAQISQRFTHVCVEEATQLAEHDRAVTRAGQVKGSASRHRKDDRKDLSNPRHWTIGVDPTTRIEQLVADFEDLKERDAALETEQGELARAERTAEARLAACARVAEVEWAEIDLAAAEATVAMWRNQIAAATAAQPDLARATADLEVASTRLAQARQWQEDLGGQCQSAEHDLARVTAHLAALEAQRAELAEGEARAAGLEDPDMEDRLADIAARLHQGRRHIDVSDIDQRARTLATALDRERSQALADQATAQGEARTIMTRFSERWSAQAADMRPELAFMPDYLAALDTLQSDGLPKHERRFSQLLASQSQRNIGQLAQAIRAAARDVMTRIAPVNEALRAVEYAPGHHLRIEVTERRFAEAEQFLADLNTISSGNLAIETETAEEAEARFATLKALMTRLASSEPADLAWRRACLDTRRHVSFRAVERDATGRAVNYYEGASGLSGGQRQKLVIFCLAAALRYQLAGSDDAPSYCLVVLDEAFDKTDADFTRAGLSVFRDFGFQLLLATPMTKIQIMEPFVGGATVVSNTPEGDFSSLHPVIFDPSEAMQADPGQAAAGDLVQEEAPPHLEATPEAATSPLDEPADLFETWES